MKRAFLLLAALVAATATFGQPSSPSYKVDRLSLKYGREHPQLPPLEDITGVDVAVALEGDAYVPSASATPLALPIWTAFDRELTFTEAALRELFIAIVAKLNARGVHGVYVVPAREQIDPVTKEDLRQDNRNLTLTIWVSEIGTIRTVAKGTRIPSPQAVLNPSHQRIFRGSPLTASSGPGTSGGLFEKTLLDDYLRRLNRHPGRTVEAAISASDEPGRVVLDYLVTEDKPWFVYGQVSNTGTEATNVLRERVGLIHNQLFSRDDVVSVDYITSGISKANAAFASYTIPILYPDRLKLRGYGSWGDFNATTPESTLTTSAGASTTLKGDEFTGESWLGSIEAVASPWAWRRYALDLTAGIGIHHVSVNNKSFRQEGTAEFLTPYVSARIERVSEVFNVAGSIGYETNLNSTPTAELQVLGRIDTSSSYDLLKGEFNIGGYIDPLIARWMGRNEGTRTVLANELTFTARGQYALGNNRLAPQKEYSIGGFFSVRGYPESAVAGDRVFMASAEYRFHVPRLLRPKTEVSGSGRSVRDEAPGTLFGLPFNYRPLHEYGRPDWDFVVRGFVDGGFTAINLGSQDTARVEDRDHTLLGTGIGLELQVKRFLNLRVDAGWALEPVRTNIKATPYVPLPGDVEAGSAKVHFLATIIW